MCNDGTIDVVPFLEAPYLETHLNLWQWWWSAAGVTLYIVVVVVHLVRVGREVRRAHGGVASDSRA
jgi:membrane protein YdbS with pleckstrin-like domain